MSTYRCLGVSAPVEGEASPVSQMKRQKGDAFLTLLSSEG